MQIIKKRGKSSKSLQAENATHVHQESAFKPENLPSNLILHLKKIPNVDCSEDFSESSILNYDPKLTTPVAYDPVKISEFSYIESSKVATNNTQNFDKEVCAKDEKWCWWCCHTFQKKVYKCLSKKTQILRMNV